MCNTETAKITEAYIFVNKVYAYNHSLYTNEATRTYFKNMLLRHETMHALGFQHNIGLFGFGNCSPYSVINELYFCDWETEVPAFFSEDDIDLINDTY